MNANEEKHNEILIDDSNRPYLNEIAERLWSGHGAVMVGAGFSKNSHPAFPNWAQLGDLFYEKAHGHKPHDQKYLNVLKLADEVQATLGRPALDQIIRSSIPEKSSEPSSLHVKLLELPWTDVFTTNYDTLLERATSAVSSQKFDVVVNKEDLVYSEKPRIVKLHGSFPSERPFIITEEDYRRYPSEFAPFVNTVQQALLENMLCLIGFSGDDPNFLHWIGWIRDNLGSKNSPKMFLVGIINLSDAQKKLLEQRNIVLVDMSQSPGVKDDHYKALDRFIDYLVSRKEEDNRLDWPRKQTFMHPELRTKNKSEQLSDLIGKWRNVRLEYPNWIIVPEDRRNVLWIYTKNWINFLPADGDVAYSLAIEYVYELNWRLEKCLCPIFNNLAALIEDLLRSYSPFQNPDTIHEASSSPRNTGDSRPLRSDIKQMWLHLTLSMLRFYRQEGRLADWQETNKILDGLYEFLLAEQVAFLHYERCLFALFALDEPQVIEQIGLWPKNESLPFWETKRAGLLAEMGHLQEAGRTLERSLRSIRSKLNLKPVSTDYSLVSQEAFTMISLRYIRGPGFLRKEGWQTSEDEERQFTVRWNNLRQYKCDPWNELKLFEKILEREPMVTPAITEQKGFDIGRVTRTHHFSDGDQEALVAYEFLTFFEEIGLPFRIPGLIIGKKSAVGSLPRISKYTPYWTFATMFRIGDAKVVDHIFNRESLYRMGISYVDSLVDQYLQAIENCGNEIKVGTGFRADNFGGLLAQVIPEVLSRLCCKCSVEAKEKLIAFLLRAYKSGHRTMYRGIGNLFQRLIDSYTDRSKFEIIPKLLQFPVLEDLNPIMNTEFVNPFTLLGIDKELASDWEKPKIDDKHVQSLLTFSRSDSAATRSWTIFTLLQLHQLGILDDVQSAELAQVLWERVDEFGFPAHTNYYRFAFITLPHPKGIEPVTLFKRFVQNAPFPIQDTKSEKGVSITGGSVPICDEIVGASKDIHWTEDEVKQILQRLFEWWKADKKFLKNDGEPVLFGSVSEEFRARFASLVDVLVDTISIALRQDGDEWINNTVRRLLSELSESRIPCLRAEAACLSIDPSKKKEIISRIASALISNNREAVVDALKANLVLIQRHRKVLSDPEQASLLILLGQMIYWRRKTGLVSALNAVVILLRDNADCVSDEFTKLVLNGLAELAEETDVAFPEMGFAEKLEIRRIAALLAYLMFERFRTGHAGIPTAITAWEQICRSDQEFAEIRNQWRAISDNQANQ